MNEVEENKKNNPWIIIVAIVAILQLVVLGAIFKDPIIEVLANMTPENEEVLYYPFDGIHVNLADESGKHYLKTNLSLEYDSSKKLELIEKNAVQIKATIIEILRSKTLSEVSTVESTKQLQKDIMNQINLLFEEIVITEVYFTDFLYQ